MPPTLKKLQDQLAAFFVKLSRRARVILVVSVVAVGSLLAYLILVDHTEFATLFAGMSTEDAARVTEQLRKNRVAYRLEAGGTSIMVPSDKVHEIRLQLAGQGLPRGSGVGFEIFDSQKFGVSDFAQQVNYRRALQGELERTISQLEAVQAARVHIAMPERQIFARRKQQVSASVTLRMQPGRVLSQASVKAIVHLVSSSEAGLSPDQITVVDTSGHMLWSGRDGITGSGGPLDYKRSMEESFERRVGEILDAAVGTGHSVVKVTAEIGLAQLEQEDTEYDPEKLAVRSESSLEEKDARGSATPAGIPGVQGNLPGGPTPTSGNADGASQRKSLTRNYEVNKTIRKKVSPAGELKRISVAVLVDKAAITGTVLPGGAAAGKEKKRKEGTQLTDLDLKALEQVVKQAVGFQASRGDLISLQSVFFAPEQGIEDKASPWFVTYLLQDKQGWVKIGGGVLAAIVLLFVLRRILRQPAPQGEMIELPRTVRELEAGPLPPAGVGALPGATSSAAPSLALGEGDPQARTLARAAAEHDSIRTASVLRAWMSGE